MTKLLKVLFVVWLSWKVELPPVCGPEFERDQYTNELVNTGDACKSANKLLMKVFYTEESAKAFMKNAPKNVKAFQREDKAGASIYDCEPVGDGLRRTPCRDSQCCVEVRD